MNQKERDNNLKGRGSYKRMERYVPLVRMSMVKEREIPYAAEKINEPEKVVKLAQHILRGADREHLLVISVDSKCRPLAVEIVSIGTVNATLAEPREIFKHAILANAAAVILVHNHPSGDCTPSREDRHLTKRMGKAGRLIGIPVADHVIIGDGFFSFNRDG